MNVFELFASIRLDTSEYESNLNSAKGKFDDFSSKLKNAGESMSNVGSTLAKSVTLPIVGIGAAVLKTGMEYEAGMSKVQAISGATSAEMDMLSDKAMEMAAKTKFSTADSAEAYQYMAMAGWDAYQMVDGLSGIMNLAAASGENLGNTSDIVTDSLTAFNLTAADSNRLADVLAATSNNANTNVSMLGDSFRYVAPVMGALGYTVEDTAIALGLMANAGIKDTQAGTALRAAVTNLISPTSSMAKVMEEYGISLADSGGNMLSFSEVIDVLRERLGGLDESTQAAAASTLFGKEAMSGMLAIINAAPEDYNKLTNAINNSKGTAEEMARIMQDNAAGAFERLKSAVDVLFTQLSQHLLPIFTSVVEKITEWVNWFGQLDAGTQKTILTIAGVAAALGPVLIVIGKVITAVGTIISAVSKIGPILAAVKTAASGLFAVLAANPIALVIAAVAALAAGFIALWNTSEEFRNFWIGLWENLKEAASAAWEAITGVFSAAWEAIKGAWSGAAGFFGGIWDGIKNAFSTAREVIGGAFEAAWNAVKGAWDNATGFFSGVWDGIKSVFGNALDHFKSIGSNMLEGIWNGIGDKIAWLKSKVTGVIDTIKGWFTGSSGFDTHSPSKWSKGVFLNVMEGGGIGFEAGKPSLMKEVESVVASVKNGLDFGVTNVGITATGTYNTAGAAQSAPQTGLGGAGNTYVTINSPVAVDAVQAAREWKKATQRMAMNYA